MDLLRRVISQKKFRTNRTGVDTKSVFGASMRFNIQDQFILLTTKKIFFRAVFEELKLFITGNTNSKILEEKGIKIWQGNTSRKYLDSIGLTMLPEGEMGCSYPHQWRNFGGEHPLLPQTKGLQGVDQLANIVEKIKNNPMDRRIYLVGSNPAQEHLMALPPCHNYAQFYCDAEEKLLSCFVLIRSNDLFLGCPFNLAQYCLLTYILAEITGYRPGELLYTAVDAHLYANHLIQAEEQTTRLPRSFPRLKFKKKIASLDDVSNLEFEDVDLVGYDPHPAIKADMAV